MSLYGIATEYNGPLEAAHDHGDDDRCDMVECGAVSAQIDSNWTSQSSYEVVASLLPSLFV